MDAKNMYLHTSMCTHYDCFWPLQTYFRVHGASCLLLSPVIDRQGVLEYLFNLVNYTSSYGHDHV